MLGEGSELGKSKEFLEEIREREKKDFPELAADNDWIVGPDYYFFYPSSFFKEGLITEQDIGTLKKPEGKILSVGSGRAYLERMLVKLGVPVENVSLADVSRQNLPSGFRTHIFDMHGEWPQLEEGPFDLIIIPQAFYVSTFSPSSQEKTIAKLGWRPSFHMFIACMLNEVILKALQHLKPGGELRISDIGCLYGETMMHLRQIFPYSLATLNCNDSGGILTVKKAMVLD